MKIWLKIFGWISVITVFILGFVAGNELAEKSYEFHYGFAILTWVFGFTGSLFPFAFAKHLENQEKMIELLSEYEEE